MPFGCLQKLRNLFPAPIFRKLASGSKGAALRHLIQRRRGSFYGVELLPLSLHGRNGTKQIIGIRVQRVPKELPGRRKLHDSSRIHHRNPVADFRSNSKIMCHHHNAHAKISLQLLQKADDLFLHCDIQGSCRLIRKEKLRSGSKRNSNHRPLPHASGELMRICKKALLCRRNSNHLHHPHCLFFLLLPAHFLLEGFHNLLSDRLHRIQRCHRLLENHADVSTADFPKLRFRHFPKILSVKQNLSPGYLSGILQNLEQRSAGHTLSAAALSDQTEGLLLPDGKGDLINGRNCLLIRNKLRLKMPDIQQYLAHCSLPF